MITINTILPIFSGFYNSIFEFDREGEDIDWYNEENKTNYKFDDFKFDYREYEERIASEIVDAVEVAIHDNLGIDVDLKFLGIDRPRFYNYRSDYIDTELSISESNLDKLKDLLRDNKEEFANYLEENYKSRSGFVSFFSYDFDEWLNDYLKFDSDKLSQAIQGALNFLLLNDDYSEWSIYDEISGEIYVNFELI